MTLRAAEFFAGMGLVRRALENVGVEVIFANDIEPFKEEIYRANFPGDEFVRDDIRNLRGRQIPDIDIATASFPCTNLSLAGKREGLAGSESGLFWEFARILEEMGKRRPDTVLIENVPGFLTSHGGRDLDVAIQELNRLGYWCDVLLVDAKHFVAQSRPRLFLTATQGLPVKTTAGIEFLQQNDPIRPRKVQQFMQSHSHLNLRCPPISAPPPGEKTIDMSVEWLGPADERWWNRERKSLFLRSLSELNQNRIRRLARSGRKCWATAYRRTRRGEAVWEIRDDGLAGCLRTARGGSSKQALVEVHGENVRIRWMTPLEYATLQGAPGIEFGNVTNSQALYALGDAVCVPAVEWVLRNRILVSGTPVHAEA